MKKIARKSFLFTVCSLLFTVIANAQDAGVCGKVSEYHRNGGSDTVKVLNGDGILGPTYNNSDCGLNYVHGSVLIERRSATHAFNTNGTGLPSSISINGLPISYRVSTAYLYFITSYISNTAPAASVFITNPASDTGTYTASIIGRAGTKCWTGVGEKGTAFYRADVTTKISGNGVYNFNINGFINGSNEIDGATLIIIFNDSASTRQGTLLIWDGGMSTSGTPPIKGDTMTGFQVCDSTTLANGFLIVSDMQGNVNGGVHKTTINGTTATFKNNFWNFDSANTTVAIGQTKSIFYTDGGGVDCYAVIATGLYFQRDSCALCDIFSGVEDGNGTDGTGNIIIVAPNPFSTYSEISLSNSENELKDAALSIYNVYGQRVRLEEHLSGSRIIIGRENLSSGVYIYDVAEKGRRIANGKLVVE